MTLERLNSNPLNSFRQTAPLLPEWYHLRQYFPWVQIIPVKTNFPPEYNPVTPTQLANIVRYKKLHEPTEKTKLSKKEKVEKPKSNKSAKPRLPSQLSWQALGDACAMYFFTYHDPVVKERVEDLIKYDFLLPDVRGLSEEQIQALTEFAKSYDRVRFESPASFLDMFEQARENYYKFDHYQRVQGYHIKSIEKSFTHKLIQRDLLGNPFAFHNRVQYLSAVNRLYQDPAKREGVLKLLELPPYQVKYSPPIYLNDEESADAKVVYINGRFDQVRTRGPAKYPEVVIWDYKLHVNPDSILSRIQMCFEGMGFETSYALDKYQPWLQEHFKLFGPLDADMHELSFLNLPIPTHFNRRDFLMLTGLRTNDVYFTLDQAMDWFKTARATGLYLKKPPRDHYAEHARALAVPEDTPKSVRTIKLQGQNYQIDEVHGFGETAMDKFQSYFGSSTHDLESIPKVDLSKPFPYHPEVVHIRHFCKIRNEDRPRPKNRKSNTPKTQIEVLGSKKPKSKAS